MSNQFDPLGGTPSGAPRTRKGWNGKRIKEGDSTGNYCKQGEKGCVETQRHMKEASLWEQVVGRGQKKI